MHIGITLFLSLLLAQTFQVAPTVSHVQDLTLHIIGNDPFIGAMRVRTRINLVVVDLGDGRRVILLDAASRDRDQGRFWYRRVRRRIYDNCSLASMEAFVLMQVRYQ